MVNCTFPGTVLVARPACGSAEAPLLVATAVPLPVPAVLPRAVPLPEPTAVAVVPLRAPAAAPVLSNVQRTASKSRFFLTEIKADLVVCGVFFAPSEKNAALIEFKRRR